MAVWKSASSLNYRSELYKRNYLPELIITTKNQIYMLVSMSFHPLYLR